MQNCHQGPHFPRLAFRSRIVVVVVEALGFSGQEGGAAPPRGRALESPGGGDRRGGFVSCHTSAACGLYELCTRGRGRETKPRENSERNTPR